MLVAAVLVSGFIWNWGRGSSVQQSASEALDSEMQSREKRKNDRLSRALRNLSNEELVRLRQRLASGEIDEHDLEAALGEDADRMRL
jgi:reverse gyrase